MGMETTDKLCCNCIHYLHGVLENPCAKDVKSVGYLKEGCWRWAKEKEAEIPTKVCSICGQEKTLDAFTHAKGVIQPYCKACRLVYKESKKRKNKCDESD